ncbi:hypothetical protein HG536_0E05590 [Torulaspora globosa]|uniref:Uncharacterized protein n=1 Tax=Torulaspora globosa TaxID=48254 RepID=A0A7G3ZJG2_9SACH|nr:uncharacterized protein HG536_0E05590 [Torulaspora globosa]QLL33648.1 hypothetical protein HG536_0E05590 [Torulaspora globosa]
MYFSILKGIYVAISLFGSLASSASVANRNISKAFTLQDKICSMKFDPKDGSYWRFFEQVTGFILPPYLDNYDKTPYTGFKFLRTYSFQPTSLNSETNLLMAFCSDGKVQWDLSVPVKQDIDWKKPLCVHIATETVETPQKKHFWAKILDIGKPPGIRKKSKKETAIADLDNFHCFKLARRKKYFNRNISLFFPGSWVGGIYFCDLTDESKRDLIRSMDDNLLLKEAGDFDFCTKTNAIPLMPLESDNYSKSWREYKSSKLLSFLGRIQEFRVTKYVPFLNTPNYPMQGLNVKTDKAPYPAMTTFTGKVLREQVMDIFHRSNSVTKAQDPWFTDIEVQENYCFSTQEERRLNKLLDQTRKTLDSISMSALNSARNFLSSSDCEQATDRTDRGARKLFNRLETKFWDHLPLYDKDLALMGSDDENLRQLDKKWKTLRLG